MRIVGSLEGNFWTPLFVTMTDGKVSYLCEGRFQVVIFL